MADNFFGAIVPQLNKQNTKKKFANQHLNYKNEED